MTDKQPDPLRVADELVEPIENFPNPTTLEKQAAALLRTQHAAIKRKDALLRQALGALDLYKAYGWPDRSGVIPAITKELSQ